MSAAQNPLTPEPITLRNPTCNIETPSRALAIGAHPDDVDFGCGATLTKWAQAGCEVSFLVCTDGSKGTWDSSTSRDELIATRQREQRDAANIIGATGEVIFLGQTDGELESNLALRAEVTHWIRLLKPTVVLGHDPWKRYRIHPDHRHAGWLVTDSVVAARDATFFPEQGLQHHRPDMILLWEADEPDHVEDVSGFADRKYEALQAHRSQHVSTMSTDTGDFRSAVMAKLETIGKAAGIGLAEAFKLLDDL